MMHMYVNKHTHTHTNYHTTVKMNWTLISGEPSDCPKAVPSASVSFNYSVSIHPSIIHPPCSPTFPLLSWRARSPSRVSQIKHIWKPLPHHQGRERKGWTEKWKKYRRGKKGRGKQEERGGEEKGGKKTEWTGGMTGDEKHHREFHHLQKTVSHLASETTRHYWSSNNQQMKAWKVNFLFPAISLSNQIV